MTEGINSAGEEGKVGRMFKIGVQYPANEGSVDNFQTDGHLDSI